jgi:predicted XRE-type DNA-binding protein
MGRVGNISSDLHRPKTGSGLRAARVSKKIASHKPKRSQSGTKASSRPLVSSRNKSKPKYEEFKSVWDALGFSPLEAANLETRSTLMIQIEKIIAKSGWTQAEAAKRCRISQPRLNDLLRGKIAKFSVDALINIASALGRRVEVYMEAA